MAMTLDIAYAIGAVLSCPVWALRLLRTGKWRTDWAARFGRGDFTAEPAPDRKALLIHAVSVGEVNAVRLLVEQLAQRAPRVRLIVSATTDTGMARAKELFEPQCNVVRYPFDFSVSVDRFLDRVCPNAVALVENEVWPNFTGRCTRRGIHVCVINGRIAERSYRRYRLVRPIAAAMYRRLDAVAAQTPAYARRFEALGAPADRVSVLDTMKWDTAQVTDAVEDADELGTQMGIDRDRPIVVLGSTGEGEERMLLDALKSTLPPQAQIIVVPRKPERFNEVAQIDPAIVRRTQCTPGARCPAPGARLFLLDTMGELAKAYRLADVVIIGRSFNGWGGSDPIEPIALGKATIIGPDHHNFADAVDALRQGGGIVECDTPAGAAEAVSNLLANGAAASQLAEAGRKVILSRQGATARHADLLLRLLGEPSETGARNPKRE